MIAKIRFVFISLFCSALLLSSTAWAQSDRAYERMNAHAVNQPLDSLAKAVERGKGRPVNPGPPREVPNYRGKGTPSTNGATNAPDVLLQSYEGQAATAAGDGFDGANNWDNSDVVGFRIAPPDTDGSIGPNHFVQMVNLITTIFDRNGTPLLEGPFASNLFWEDMGGNCGKHNQGDPIVLYDDQANRWLVSQFAFPDNLKSYSQCVAVSQTPDPTGAYNRYEFSFNGIGFNDYPKHGIVDGAITLMANIFTKRGQNFRWGGTYLAVLDKDRMYVGASASMRGFKLGTSEFGFVAGDLDGPGSAPALFATAMSTSNRFDIWEITPNWSGSSASIEQIASVSISGFNPSLCGASRGACIPQLNGPDLESLSDRLMHRLQIRDFGSHRSMVASHTVDADGSGTAGIRWYEFRETGGTWTKHQEGTYAPNDGLHRWMPSIAMNGQGDIGIGYLFSSDTSFMSIAAVGQTAAASGSGVLDSDELVCVYGGGPQTGVSRSGDYSSTSVDPLDDTTFWHTNEYVFLGGHFVWDTYVCPFTVGDGGDSNTPPNAVISTATCTDDYCIFNGSGSSDPDGSIVQHDWNFGDGNSGSGVDTDHTYLVEGSYTVTLTVTDVGDLQNSDTVDLDVDDGFNQTPVAVIAQPVNCAGLTCNFDGSGSSDPDLFSPDGDIVSYKWNFGDSYTGTGATPSFTYDTAGEKTVKLTVTDDGDSGGLTSTEVSVVVNVTEPPVSTTMHVASIVLDTRNSGGGNKSPRAVVTIVDNNEDPVVSATVNGTFIGNGAGTGSGTTNSSGVATVVSDGSARGRVRFEFCVDEPDGVTHPPLTYEPLDNVVLRCQSN